MGGLTLRQVAGLVGMRAPSLYGHFASKGAIVDAIFADASETYGRSTAPLEHALPANPREALLVIARTYVDFAISDPQRHALMSRRPVPGFQPSPEAYAPAVRSLARLGRVLHRLGVSPSRPSVSCWYSTRVSPPGPAIVGM